MRSLVRARSLFSLILALTLGFLATADVAGQTTAGSIFGSVTDQSGARLPGVTVTASSPQLIGGQDVRVTGPDGTYRFPSLPPGTYIVAFELPSFQTIRFDKIVLLSGQSLPIDAKLEVGGVREEVTVIAQSEIIDTRNSGLVNIQEQAVLENIPVSRQFNQLLNIMPGVTDARYGFAPVNVIHGSSVRQNEYSVDGITFDDAIQSTSAFTIPVDTWQEIQITTGGISAEHGDASGAVVNYISKSGGNTFKGTGNFFYQDKNMQSNNLPSSLQSTSGAGIDRVYEYGGALGGPVKKDRVWFFTNYRYYNNTVRVLDFSGLPQVKEDQWYSKGTIKATDNHKAAVSFYYWNHDNFPWADVASFRNSGDPETWMGIQKEVHMMNPSWSSVLSKNTLFEVTGSTMIYKIVARNPNETGGFVYIDQATGIVTGGDTHSAGDNRRNRHLVKADLSHFKENLGGQHNFKVGFRLQSTPVYQEGFIQGARGRNELVGCSDGCLSELPDTVHLLFNTAPFRVRLYNSPIRQNFGMRKWNGYAQDQWVIKERVTLNLGVRIDSAYGTIEESPQGGGQWEPNVVTFPQQKGVIHITDFSPRAGFVWDVKGDHRSTIKGSGGRYYHNLGVAYLQPPHPVALGYREFDWADSNNNGHYDVGEEGTLRADTRIDPTKLPTVDPNLKNGYTNVFTVGFEQQVGNDWRFSATGIFKRDKNLVGIINTAVPFSAYQRITVTNPLDNQPFEIFTLPTQLQSVRPQQFLTNPREQNLRRQYNGMELVFNRRLKDAWQMQVSYVWGLSEGNIANQYGNSDYGRFLNPNDYINRFGQLSLGAEHQFKTFGTWLAPYGIAISGYFQALSGTPLINTPNFLIGVQGARTVRFLRADWPQIQAESFIDVAGEPAGTQKFKNQTALDLRLEKKFSTPLGTLALLADIFNIYNAGAIVRVADLRLGSPAFLAPSEVQTPRQLRLGIKWDF